MILLSKHWEYLVLPLLSSTYSVAFKLTVFVLIRSYSAWHGFDFVMASAGLLSLLIHLISVISRCLYDCRKHIRLTINFFSCVVPSLTRQS
jgi:hypothetical protein